MCEEPNPIKSEDWEIIFDLGLEMKTDQPGLKERFDKYANDRFNADLRNMKKAFVKFTNEQPNGIGLQHRREGHSRDDAGAWELVPALDEDAEAEEAESQADTHYSVLQNSETGEVTYAQRIEFTGKPPPPPEQQPSSSSQGHWYRTSHGIYQGESARSG